MIATRNPEYRKLALDSSNDMMDHDGDRGLGRYPKAAWHILQAGQARLRMGRIMFDEKRLVFASEDWLSAAACFYLVPNLERMRDAFERVQALAQAGKIPPERRDIHAAIKERAEQIETLERKLIQFREDARHKSGQDALDWLLAQVRELPGLAELHTAIAQVATRFGQTSLAAEHRTWAERFAPNESHVEANPSPHTNGASERNPADTETLPTS